MFYNFTALAVDNIETNTIYVEINFIYVHVQLVYLILKKKSQWVAK